MVSFSNYGDIMVGVVLKLKQPIFLVTDVMLVHLVYFLFKLFYNDVLSASLMLYLSMHLFL